MDNSDDKPNKYQSGKIYKIVDIGYKRVYIGSTIQDLSKRMASHRCDYNRFKNGKAGFVSVYAMFDEFTTSNCKIELIEDYPCTSLNELQRREGYHIMQHECINKLVAGRTYKEWLQENLELSKERERRWRSEHKDHIQQRDKLYYELNKESILERHKQHYDDNKETILAKQNEYYHRNKNKNHEKHKQYRIDNKEKCNTYCREWYRNNKDKVRAYCATNAEKIKERTKLYRENNKDYFREHEKKYTIEHKERIALQRKEYNEKHKERIQAYRSEKLCCPHCEAMIARSCMLKHTRRMHPENSIDK